MRSHSTVLVAAAALALGSAASAQTREGFFIGVGTSWAWGQASAAGVPSADGHMDWLLPIRLGWKVSDHVSLGAESGVWGASDDDRAVNTGYYGVALYYYPAAKGLFFKGGLGRASADIGGVNQESVSGAALGGVLGAGYDIPIGRKTAVTPMATFRFGGPSTLSPRDGSGAAVHDFKHNVVELGVGFSFY